MSLIDDDKPYIVQVPDVIDADQCQALITRIESLKPAIAPINSMSGTRVRTDIRNNYRYKPGMRFAPHSDGAFVRDETEMSFYSYLVYLNCEFEGGQTTFLTEPEIQIEPQTGWGLIFQHPLLHEGSEVTSGTKYVARTDLMYRKSE